MLNDGYLQNPAKVRTKCWWLFTLTDLVAQWPWSPLLKYFEASTAIHSTVVQEHFANISLNTKNSFSAQHWSCLLPAEVVTISVKTLWAHYTPGKVGNIHEKKALAKGQSQLSSSVVAKASHKSVCLSVNIYLSNEERSVTAKSIGR